MADQKEKDTNQLSLSLDALRSAEKMVEHFEGLGIEDYVTQTVVLELFVTAVLPGLTLVSRVR